MLKRVSAILAGLLVVLAVFASQVDAAQYSHFGIARNAICNDTQSASLEFRATATGTHTVDAWVQMPNGAKLGNQKYTRYLVAGQYFWEGNIRTFIPYTAPGDAFQWVSIKRNGVEENRWALRFRVSC